MRSIYADQLSTLRAEFLRMARPDYEEILPDSGVLFSAGCVADELLKRVRRFKRSHQKAEAWFRQQIESLLESVEEARTNILYHFVKMSLLEDGITVETIGEIRAALKPIGGLSREKFNLAVTVAAEDHEEALSVLAEFEAADAA